uniref:CCHC-type domain-containing protein n=1 Tax=Steinernema glaseri TaxID=37863 RepID=A0A1I7Z0M6_9BILA
MDFPKSLPQPPPTPPLQPAKPLQAAFESSKVPQRRQSHRGYKDRDYQANAHAARGNSKQKKFKRIKRNGVERSASIIPTTMVLKQGTTSMKRRTQSIGPYNAKERAHSEKIGYIKEKKHSRNRTGIVTDTARKKVVNSDEGVVGTKNPAYFQSVYLAPQMRNSFGKEWLKKQEPRSEEQSTEFEILNVEARPAISNNRRRKTPPAPAASAEFAGFENRSVYLLKGKPSAEVGEAVTHRCAPPKKSDTALKPPNQVIPKAAPKRRSKSITTKVKHSTSAPTIKERRNAMIAQLRYNLRHGDSEDEDGIVESEHEDGIHTDRQKKNESGSWKCAICGKSGSEELCDESTQEDDD